jgi:hypothetical protein
LVHISNSKSPAAWSKYIDSARRSAFYFLVTFPIFAIVPVMVGSSLAINTYISALTMFPIRCQACGSRRKWLKSETAANSAGRTDTLVGQRDPWTGPLPPVCTSLYSSMAEPLELTYDGNFQYRFDLRSVDMFIRASTDGPSGFPVVVRPPPFTMIRIGDQIVAINDRSLEGADNALFIAIDLIETGGRPTTVVFKRSNRENANNVENASSSAADKPLDETVHCDIDSAPVYRLNSGLTTPDMSNRKCESLPTSSFTCRCGHTRDYPTTTGLRARRFPAVYVHYHRSAEAAFGIPKPRFERSADGGHFGFAGNDDGGSSDGGGSGADW